MMSYKSENSVFLRPCLVGARQRSRGERVLVRRTGSKKLRRWVKYGLFDLFRKLYKDDIDIRRLNAYYTPMAFDLGY